MNFGTWIRSGAARIVGAAIIGGVVVGGGAGLLGVGSAAPDPSVLALDAVPIYACPGVGELGTLHRGDRVLITGRSGEWLAVRNVRGGGERVFVHADAVTPDADLTGLRTEDCDDQGSLAVGSTTSVPDGSTTTVPDGTTTTTGDTTTTTVGVTTTIQATTTTADTTPPSITNAFVTPSLIYELDSPGLACGPEPRDADVSAFVSDASGVASVTLRWKFENASQQSKPMVGSGNYTTTFGPFPYGTVADGEDEDVTLTIRAVDTRGNVETETLEITVRSSGSCLG